MKTDAGEVYQVVVSANTRLTRERQPMKMAEIKVGDGVGAMGVMDAPTKTIHAVFVGVVDAEQVKKAREGLGKVYITGKVTAVDMDALKVTVLRPDGVSQVIGVDEGTSFKRGGRGMAAMMNGSGARGGWRWRGRGAECGEYYAGGCEGGGSGDGEGGVEERRVCADGAGRGRCCGDGAETATRREWWRGSCWSGCFGWRFVWWFCDGCGIGCGFEVGLDFCWVDSA